MRGNGKRVERIKRGSEERGEMTDKRESRGAFCLLMPHFAARYCYC